MVTLSGSSAFTLPHCNVGWYDTIFPCFKQPSSFNWPLIFKVGWEKKIKPPWSGNHGLVIMGCLYLSHAPLGLGHTSVVKSPSALSRTECKQIQSDVTRVLKLDENLTFSSWTDLGFGEELSHIPVCLFLFSSKQLIFV